MSILLMRLALIVCLWRAIPDLGPLLRLDQS
jgi:hypothetical protein